ncbi:MAG: hypothetical protein Q9178_005273 [Gyalolechia marmorata]
MANPWGYQLDEWMRSPELRAIGQRARNEAEDYADVSLNQALYAYVQEVLLHFFDERLLSASDWSDFFSQSFILMLLLTADLLAFTPNEDLLEDLRIRGMKVHYLEKALGNSVNLDQYALEIIRLPSLAGQQLTKKELVRTHFNDYIDISLGEFVPYNEQVKSIWESSNPLRTVFEFMIKLENAAVNCSEADSPITHWKFSTVGTPDMGDHPVSGTREVGIGQSATGNPTLYTRGVDRPTNQIAAMRTWYVFCKADQLWRSYRKKVASS